MNIFKNAQYSYLLLGFILLIISFILILSIDNHEEKKTYSIIKKTLIGCVGIIFLYHGAGLGMRWYITGHAPWSNGYEAVIFIAWVTILAGFLFTVFLRFSFFKKSKF